MNTLVLQDADLAALRLLKSKKSGEVVLTITHASVEEDVVFITKKKRIYEFKKKDLFR